jgi:hypothetical protein
MSVTITYWLHFDYCGPLCYPIPYDDESLIHINKKWDSYFIALSNAIKWCVAN